MTIKLKHSVMVPLMGRQADRFHEYQSARSLEERLAMVQRVQAVDGIEVVYPHDLAELERAVTLIQGSGLPVSAVNLNVKSAPKWQTGSFTARDPDLRADAVTDLKRAMDLAAELGAWMVSCCPLIDGHNYAFQADYLEQWRWLREGIAEAASHRTDVKISLEYKLNESRNFCILGDMGRTLYLCERIGAPNVGVTMDVGHALMAKETPAEVMCLAAQAGRLFYVHFNDNGREWDWDMLPGSVNLWDLIEMVFYLDRLNWEGWLAYDVSTRNGDPVEMMEATISIMDAAQELVAKLGRERLRHFVEEGLPARAFSYLVRSLL
jgi:xylose isomerase